MAKLLDSEGKLWALMSSKDKAGRIYIRAYRNRWDSVKKRSFVESKVQVGRLLDDGSIRLSKNFVDKFPQYAHQTVFWGDHELISEENFSEAFVQKPESTDISWSHRAHRCVVRRLAVWPKYRHLRRSSKCVWRTNRTNSVRSQRL